MNKKKSKTKKENKSKKITSSAKIKKAELKIDLLNKELEELKEKNFRILAEFENFLLFCLLLVNRKLFHLNIFLSNYQF